MKVRTKWDRQVWCRDSAWETSAEDQDILIWGSEIEYALGSNVNEYITKGDLEFIEWDADYTPAADDTDILYDTNDVTLDNEKVTESTALVETPVIFTEDRNWFLEGDLVDITIPGIVSGSMGPINTQGLVGVYINNDYEVFVSKEQIVKRIELTPGAVYRLGAYRYILTIDNTFVGIDTGSAGHLYTLEQTQKLNMNVTKE